MFFEIGDAALPKLRDHVKRLCDSISHERHVSLLVRESTLFDCLESAKISATFHHIPLENLSHYKELAHIGFWIAKLKPVSLASPITSQFILKGLLDWGDRVVSGFSAKVIRLADDPIGPYKAALGFPLNEFIAMTLIWEACEARWEFALNQLEDDGKKRFHEERVGYLRNRFFRELLHDLAVSLRFHTYTSRTFATTVESLLSLHIELPVQNFQIVEGPGSSDLLK